MPVGITHLTAFLLGFFGGGHCVGMCGGIVGALTFGLKEETRQNWASTFPFILMYNLGRLISYSIAGAIAAGIGLFTLDVLTIHHAQLVLKMVAGVFMILLGLYLGGWWFGLLKVEQVGARLWRYIEPIGRRLMPVQTLGQAFVLGLVWGWLPCGLVYSVLIFAFAASSIGDGAAIMFSFGLGTLPTVMTMGLFATFVGSIVRHPWVRKGAGVFIILFGIYTITQGADIQLPSSLG